MLPTGSTRVVIAKVHPNEPKFNCGAATAADDVAMARDPILPVPLPQDAGAPRQLPSFPQVVDPEPRFAKSVPRHCIPNASFTPRHCGRLNQTATPDAPALAGAATTSAATTPASSVLSTNSSSMSKTRNSKSSIRSNTAVGAAATSTLPTTSTAAA